MSTTVLERPAAETQPEFEQLDQAEFATPISAHEHFSEDEIEALHRDDAMTAGMITIILGLAFTVLLGLVIGVNIWMAMSVE